MRIATALLCTTFAAAPLSAARLTAQEPSAAGKWGAVFSFDALTSRYEHRSGAPGVGSRGWGLALGGAATLSSVLVGGMDLGFAGVGDDSSFSNSTTAGTKESSTSTFFISAFAGLKTPLFGLNERRTLRAVLGANLGVSNWSGKRSIDSCVDCDEEDVRIRGGAYVEPYVIIGGSNPRVLTGLKVAFRIYTSSDATVKNVIFVGIGGVRGR